MELNIPEEKIKVFISSKCGNESYDLVRIAIKRLLEETGFIKTYLFEESASASKNTRDEYLNKLEDCHIVLFLIDNVDEIFSEGIMKEWKHAKDLQRKSIYLFYNDSNKIVTTIQRQLEGPKGEKYKEVGSLKEFIDEGYKAVVQDIFSIYIDYCKNRIVKHPLVNQSVKQVEISKHLLKDGNIESLFFGKNRIKSFPKTEKYFENIQKEKDFENIETNMIDEFASCFIQVLSGGLKFEEFKIELFYQEIRDIHTEVLAELIIIRWKAIFKLYNNDLQAVIKNLEEAYNYARKNKVSQWIIDDILIDKRNLENKLMNYSNTFGEGESQILLNSNDHMLNYPLLDRIEGDVHEAILNEIYKKNIESPFSSTIGSGMNRVIKNIFQAYVVAFGFGSLTHLNSTIKLLKETFHHFSSIYSYYQWKYLNIQYAILDCDIKTMEKFYNRNKEIFTSCSFEKIEELYGLTNAIPYIPERNLVKVTLIGLLGYYFSDEDYAKINEEFSNIINTWAESPNPIIIYSKSIINCFKENIHRIDQESLVIFALKVITRKLFRFYDDMFDLLSYVKWNKISDPVVAKVLIVIEEIMLDSELRENCHKLRDLIVCVRKTLKNKESVLKWDVIIKDNWNSFYENQYEIEILQLTTVNSGRFLIENLTEISRRNNLQGKEGTYSSFGDKPFRTMRNIIEYSEEKVVVETYLHSFISVIQEVLLNPKQTTEEKIECFHFMFYLKAIARVQGINELHWIEFNRFLLENQEDLCTSRHDMLFNKMTKFTLETNLIFWKAICNESKSEEIIKIVSDHYSASVYDNIQLIKLIERYLEYYNLIGEKEIPYKLILLQNLLAQTNDSNFEVEYLAVKCLVQLLNSELKDVIINALSRVVDNADFRIKLLVIAAINVDESVHFKSIIEKLIVDNNYLVRKEVLRITRAELK